MIRFLRSLMLSGLLVLSALPALAQRPPAAAMGIDQEKALALLRLRNIKADSASQTLAEIAHQNGVAPGGVFEALKMVQEPSAGPVAGLPKDPPPGLGRRKLSDICEEYGLDSKAVLARLDAAGLKAHPAWTLAEVAKTNNVSTYTIYETLREEKPLTQVQVEVSSTQPTVTPKAEPAAPTPIQPSRVEPEAPKPLQTQPAPLPANQPTTHAPQPYQPALPHEVPLQQAPATVASPSLPGHQPAPVQAEPAQSGYQGTTHQPVPPARQPLVPPPAQPVQVQPVQVQPAQPAQPAYPPAQTPPGLQPTPSRPGSPPPGLEKMMLQTYCREYNIPLSTAVGRLARHKITAFGDMTFEELSLENNKTPSDILRLVTGQ